MARRNKSRKFRNTGINTHTASRRERSNSRNRSRKLKYNTRSPGSNSFTGNWKSAKSRKNDLNYRNYNSRSDLKYRRSDNDNSSSTGFSSYRDRFNRSRSNKYANKMRRYAASKKIYDDFNVRKTNALLSGRITQKQYEESGSYKKPKMPIHFGVKYDNARRRAKNAKTRVDNFAKPRISKGLNQFGEQLDYQPEPKIRKSKAGSKSTFEGMPLIHKQRIYLDKESGEEIVYTDFKPVSDQQPIQPKFVSAVFVFLILLFVPLASGAIMNIIESDIDPNVTLSNPADVNGFQWVDGEQGDCTGVSRPVQNIGNTYFDDPNYFGKTGTTLTRIHLSNANPSCGQNQVVSPADEFQLSLPSLIFNTNDIARFSLEWVESVGCGQNNDNCSNYQDETLEFDWWVTVDAGFVFGSHQVVKDSFILDASSAGIVKSHDYFYVNHTLSIVDSNMVDWAVTNASGHSVIFHWDNLTTGLASVGVNSAVESVGEVNGVIYVEVFTYESIHTRTSTRAFLFVMGTTKWNPFIDALKKAGVDAS